MTASFDLDAPDRFTAGAVGAPGARTFYLQAGQGSILVTLKCEKEQVAALGEYLAGLLVRLGITARSATADLELAQPIEPAWAVGSIGVGWDESTARIIVVASEAVEGEAEEGDDGEATGSAAGAAEPEPEEEKREPPRGALARFRLTPAQAQAFVERARTVVKGGRPSCPMCGQTQEAGHLCPRGNGYLAR